MNQDELRKQCEGFLQSGSYELKSWAEIFQEMGMPGPTYDIFAHRLEAFARALVAKPICTWQLSSTEEYWETACGEAHCFITDGPKENEYQFCCYCGGTIDTEIQRIKEGA